MAEYYKERINTWGVEEHYVQEKFPSGMTAEFGFSWDNRPGELIIYPYLTVFAKRKKRWPDDPKQTTGRDGLAPAMFALKQLENVVEQHLQEFGTVRVSISWTDRRRRDTYAKVLGRRGYYFTQWDGEKVLERVYRAP